MDELITKQQAIDAIDEISHEVDDGYGFDYAKWREYFCELPSIQFATDTNVGDKLGTNLAEVGADCISRHAAIDALNVLCQEHRYKIPGKGETYSQYNEAWQDALDRVEGEIFNLPPAEPKIIRCRDCRYYNHEEKECLDLLGHGRRWEEDDFCSYGERKEVTE